MMMTFSSFDLIRRLEAAGVTVSTDGGDLVIRPASRVPSDLVATIKAHKIELVEFLDRTIGDDRPDTGDRIAGLPTEAYDDSDRLAEILDEDRGIGLEALRNRAETLGITARRFARALAALPERYDDPIPRNPDGTPREPGSDDDRED